jgi:hypothetical protein
MAAPTIQGATSGNVAEVTAANQLNENTPTVVNQGGYEAILGVKGDAAAVAAGGVFLESRIETSDSYRVRSAFESPLFYDQFPSTTINQGVWKQTTTTMTITASSGFCNLNNSALTTVATGALLQTYRAYPLYQDGHLRMDSSCLLTTGPQLGVVVEIGLGTPNTAITVPLDGAFFRINQQGQTTCVLSNNGLENIVTLSYKIPTNQVVEYSIIVNLYNAYFFINNILYAVIPAGPNQAMLSTAGTTNTPSANTLSIADQSPYFRINNVVAPPVATVLKIRSCSVTLLDIAGNRQWRDAMAGTGNMIIQMPTGGTVQGSTSNWGSGTGAAPTTIATLSNTTAAGAGQNLLGGQFAFAGVAGSEVDYIIFGYQNLAAALTVPGKTMYITNIAIDMAVSTAAANAAAFQWAIAVGSSAVSLATTETLGTSKAPRVLGVGQMAFASGAAVQGAQGTRVKGTFNSPLVVNQSEWLHIIMKQYIGTAADGLYRGVVMINGYWE